MPATSADPAVSADPAGFAELTRRTEEVFARRMEAARRMLAGKGSYDDVLAFHAEDFVWVSAAGTLRGHAAAREYAARRMAALPPEAMRGMEVLQTRVAGEYAFLTFRTDLIPFGTDTFVFRDGRVVFQSNALYVPRQVREMMHAAATPAPSPPAPGEASGA